MKTYEQLALHNSTTIEALRKAKAEWDAARQEMKEFQKRMESVRWQDQEAYEEEAAQLERKTLGAQHYMDDIGFALAGKVEEAYQDTPFAKTRDQGITAFWHLVWQDDDDDRVYLAQGMGY